MTNKQLMRLLGVLVAAVTLWGIFAFARHSHRDAAEGLVLPKIDSASVDTLVLTKGHDTATVVRQADGHWRVNGFRAAPSVVGQLLGAVRDTSNWSELAAEHASSEAAMGVAADSSRLVRIAVKGGKGLALRVGHNTADYDGVYVRPVGDSVTYALHGPLADALDHGLDDYRDKTIVSLGPDSVARIEVMHGHESYGIFRVGTQWRLTTGSLADSGAVAHLLGQFHPATAIGFAPAAEADSVHFSRPTARVRFYANGPRPVATVRFDSTKDKLYAKADTGSTVYLVDSWMLDQMAPLEKSMKASTPKPR